jgi:hypothetical protein
MSKEFLTESQIRRFQTLASVPSIREMDEMPPEEEMSDDMPPMDGEEMSMEPEMEPELEPEMADAPEEGGELDLSPEQKETLAADIVRAVAQELEGALELDAPIEVAVWMTWVLWNHRWTTWTQRWTSRQSQHLTMKMVWTTKWHSKKPTKKNSQKLLTMKQSSTRFYDES